MRCRGAQRLMTAAVDGELPARRARALERHVTVCAACEREMAATTRVLALVAEAPASAAVSAGLEQATLRRVRLLAGDGADAGRERRWSLRLPVVAAATATAAALALLVLNTNSSDSPVVGGTPRAADRAARSTGVARPAPAEAETRGTGRVRVARERVVPAEVPSQLPAALAAAPGLFIDLGMLKDLEKVENFEAIRTTTLDDDPASGQEAPSNG